MDLDDHVCLCFRVTRRKLENYVRLHQPKVASQLSECQLHKCQLPDCKLLD